MARLPAKPAMNNNRACDLGRLGAGTIGSGAAAIGVGLIFGNFVSGALRNPSAAQGQFTNAIIGAALAEGLGIFAFLIAILLYLK